MCSILVLGDGNFSFSMALATMMKNEEDVHLVATSFDDAQSLKDKFPESTAFLQRIHAAGGQTAHGVDVASLSIQMLPRDSVSYAPFDHIIFHHPHLGVEDMRQHQALLGHFFYAASRPEMLKSHAAIHVSVGGRQAADWNLREQAARHGLTVALETEFPTPSLRALSYEKKRHQAGRSFETACLISTNYTLRRAASCPAPSHAPPPKPTAAPGSVQNGHANDSAAAAERADSRSPGRARAARAARTAAAVVPAQTSASEQGRARAARTAAAVVPAQTSASEQGPAAQHAQQHRARPQAQMQCSTDPAMQHSTLQHSTPQHRRLQCAYRDLPAPGAVLSEGMQEGRPARVAHGAADAAHDVVFQLASYREWPPWLWGASDEERHAALSGVALAAAAGAPASDARATGTVLPRLPCPQCDRVFKCQRGLKQHVHMVHTLGAVAVQPRQRYACGTCGAAFGDRRAAQLHAAECGQASVLYVRRGATPGADNWPEHTRSAEDGPRSTAGHSRQRGHDGADAELGGDMLRAVGDDGAAPCRAAGAAVGAVGGSGRDGGHRVDVRDGEKGKAVATGVVECSLCGLRFSSDAEEQAHHAWLAPREEEHRCASCGRAFGDDRALRQHAAVCAVAEG
eukprot:jgi/Ulvmu1/5482/UM023_0018.1